MPTFAEEEINLLFSIAVLQWRPLRYKDNFLEVLRKTFWLLFYLPLQVLFPRNTRAIEIGDPRWLPDSQISDKG